MFDCPKFAKLSVADRNTLVKKEVLCWHCLSSHHFVKECKKDEGKKCDIGKCILYHHKLLHQEKPAVHFEYLDEPYGPLDENEEQRIMHIYA